MAKDQVTIVIPVLNEEKAIGQVIEELRMGGYSNILVVDGYSTDRTVDTPYMLVMDGDYIYCAKDVARLLNHSERYA